MQCINVVMCVCLGLLTESFLKACVHCNAHRNVHLAESNSMRIECTLITFTLLFEICRRWAKYSNYCTTRSGVKLYADAVACCTVLILLFTYGLSIERATGEGDSR